MSDQVSGKSCRALTPFASRTLTEHLIRGTVGISALSVIFFKYQQWPLGSLLLIPVVIFAFRGCPMCWLTGLIDTLAMKFRNLKN